MYEQDSGDSGVLVRPVGLFTGLVHLQELYSPGPRGMPRGGSLERVHMSPALGTTNEGGPETRCWLVLGLVRLGRSTQPRP